MFEQLDQNKKSKPIVWIIITVILVLIVGTLSYWFSNRQAKKELDELISQKNTLQEELDKLKASPSSSPSISPSISPSATVSPTIYKNSKYGFELTLPSSWKNYAVGEKNQSTYGYIYYFGLPFTDSNWQQEEDMPAGSASLFALSVFTLEQWDKVQAEGGPFPTVIKTTDKYVYTWSVGQAYPLELGKYRDDPETIISSFKLSN